MKIVILLSLMLYSSFGQAQFIGFKENVSKDSFLGLGITSCSTTTHDTKKNYQKAYVCGNDTISQLLHLNFLSSQFLGQQFYIFNDFMYWMSSRNQMGQWNGKDAQQAAHEQKAAAQPDQIFGPGAFMIVLGTSSYLQTIADQAQVCPEGQTLLVAQLKYNNGDSLHCWSQDMLCVAPTDSFEIQVTSDIDTAFVGHQKNISSGNLDIDWMQDPGPAANYQQAKDSPRRVRLIKQAGVVVPTVQKSSATSVTGPKK